MGRRRFSDTSAVKQKDMRRINMLIPVSVMLLVMLLPMSCKRKEENTLRQSAIELYHMSKELIEGYSDGILKCNDSISIYKTDSIFEKKMTSLNFRFPPNTSLSMSEDENDTLVRLTTRYVFLRDSLLYRFGNPIILRPDSV